jgi:hypothetical protein
VNPKRRRFQFGVRRLLLWTVVIAVYLSVVKWLRMDLMLFAVLTAWLGIVAGVKARFGSMAAFVVSILAGAVVGGWEAYVTFLAGGLPAASDWAAVVFLFVLGYALWGGVEVAFGAVDCVDRHFTVRARKRAWRAGAEQNAASSPPGVEDDALD